ncbi:MAG TPA: glycosyltransferase family 2 protein, partial [Terriglobales bacterium]|nr:glycosyltransferase family 2 protein [Terriglobales bacterium]
DSILEEDALLRLVRPFLDRPGVTVAAGGHVRIANGCVVANGRIVDVRLPRRALPLIQTVEYLRSFLFARTGWSAVNGLLIIAGAFGLFERRAVVDAGGYAADAVGEDLELVLRLHHTLRRRGRPYRVTFVSDPVCWTQVPDTVRTLGLQRNRWQRGLIDALWRHRGMFGRPRFGVVGMLSMPCLVLFEVLAPVVEVSGYAVVLLAYGLGWLDGGFFLALFTVAILYGVALSVAAVLLEDVAFRRYPRVAHLLLLVVVGIVEHFGYRQLTAWWGVRAFWDAWRGDRRWGRMEHRGFASETAPVVRPS